MERLVRVIGLSPSEMSLEELEEALRGEHNLDEAHRLEFFLRDLASLEKVNFSDVYKPLLIEKLEQKRSKKWRD